MGAVAEDGDQMLRDVRLKALAMEGGEFSECFKFAVRSSADGRTEVSRGVGTREKILRQSLELEMEKAQLSKMIKERNRKQMLRNRRREERRADPFSSVDDDDVEFSIDEEDEEITSSSSSAALSADVNQSDDEDDEDADEGAKEKGMVSSFDADPFVSNNSSVASAKEQDGVMIMEEFALTRAISHGD